MGKLQRVIDAENIILPMIKSDSRSGEACRSLGIA